MVEWEFEPNRLTVLALRDFIEEAGVLVWMCDARSFFVGDNPAEFRVIYDSGRGEMHVEKTGPHSFHMSPSPIAFAIEDPLCFEKVLEAVQ